MKLFNKRKNSKKGFTLAELLAVVAIIAVLMAIAIPTFSAATRKAEDALRAANCRSAFGEFMVASIGGMDVNGEEITYSSDAGFKYVASVADNTLTVTCKTVGATSEDVTYQTTSTLGTAGEVIKVSGSLTDHLDKTT